MPRVAIIGGGLSGLSTAYELTRRGHEDFVVYESSSRLGGIVETHREAGFIIECGADSWVTEKPWARDLAVELGLEAEIIPSEDAHRRTYLLYGDRLTPMPDGMRMMVPGDLAAIEASPLFTREARRAYSEEPARAQELKAFAAARRPGDDESIASFVRRHFGEEVTEKIARPLLSGVFGGDIDRLSAAAVMTAFVKMEREHGSLILALQQQQCSSGNKGSVFTSLKGGLQTLIERMGERIASKAIRLNEGVVSIDRSESGWEITTALGRASFDKVVVATPIHVARLLLSPLHPELSGLLDMEATSAVVAAFAFDSEASAQINVPEGFGFLVPQSTQTQNSGAEPELLATTFVNQKFSHRAPEGCTLLRAFFGGDAAPGLLTASDESILSLAARRLSTVLGPLPNPKVAIVRRWPRSLPQYAVGHRGRVARTEAILAQFPGLALTGNGLHGVGLPDMVRLGRQAALALR
jgi:oxygen-dependent protoporphyrinogen oxidase